MQSINEEHRIILPCAPPHLCYIGSDVLSARIYSTNAKIYCNMLKV